MLYILTHVILHVGILRTVQRFRAGMIFKMYLKEVFFAQRVCIYLVKNTIKTII